MAEFRYPCHKHEITDKCYLAIYTLKELIESIVVRIELGGPSFHLWLWAVEGQLIEIL